MTTDTFRSLTLSLPGTEAAPHFDRTAFRIVKKRIFATLHEASQSANLVLSPEEQAEFVALHPAIYPVPNKFGLHGWTTFELPNLPDELIQAGLETAYNIVLKSKPKK